jgi:hypothetical protein
MTVPDRLKKISVSQAVGAAALLLGCGWIGGMIFEFFGPDGDDPFATALLLAFAMPFMMLPGLCSAYFGYKLIKSPEKKYIKGAVGSLVIVTFISIPPYTIPGCFAAYCIVNLIRTKEPKFIKAAFAWSGGFAVMLAFEAVASPILDSLYEEYGVSGISLIAVVTILFPAYVYLSMFVMKREGLDPGRFKDFIGQGIVLVYTILLLGVVGAIQAISMRRGFEFSELDSATTPIDVAILMAGAFMNIFLGFAPVIVAVLFYRFAMKKVNALHAEDVAPEPDAASFD